MSATIVAEPVVVSDKSASDAGWTLVSEDREQITLADGRTATIITTVEEQIVEAPVAAAA